MNNENQLFRMMEKIIILMRNERSKDREERKMEGKREKPKIFTLFVSIIYIILMSYM